MLIINDDGCGLAKDIDFDNANSLGVKLTDVLKKQLKAKLEVSSSQSSYILSYPLPKNKQKEVRVIILIGQLLQNKKVRTVCLKIGHSSFYYHPLIIIIF